MRSGGRHAQRHTCKRRSKVRVLLSLLHRDGICMSSLHKLPKSTEPDPAPQSKRQTSRSFEGLDTRTISLAHYCAWRHDFSAAIHAGAFRADGVRSAPVLCARSGGRRAGAAPSCRAGLVRRLRSGSRWPRSDWRCVCAAGRRDHSLSTNYRPARGACPRCSPAGRRRRRAARESRAGGRGTRENRSSKPPPGVMRVQVEEPRVTATRLLWSGRSAQCTRSIS